MKEKELKSQTMETLKMHTIKLLLLSQFFFQSIRLVCAIALKC